MTNTNYSVLKNIYPLLPEYWDSQIDSCNCTVSRKIPILTRQKNLFLIFNKSEFNALKFLLFGEHCIELDDLTRKISKDHLFLN